MAWSKGDKVYIAEGMYGRQQGSWGLTWGEVISVGRVWVRFIRHGSKVVHRFPMIDTDTTPEGVVDQGPMGSLNQLVFPSPEDRDEFVAVRRYWTALQTALRTYYAPPVGVKAADLKPLVEKLGELK